MCVLWCQRGVCVCQRGQGEGSSKHHSLVRRNGELLCDRSEEVWVPRARVKVALSVPSHTRSYQYMDKIMENNILLKVKYEMIWYMRIIKWWWELVMVSPFVYWQDHTPQDLVELVLRSSNNFVKQLVEMETSKSQVCNACKETMEETLTRKNLWIGIQE